MTESPTIFQIESLCRAQGELAKSRKFTLPDGVAHDVQGLMSKIPSIIGQLEQELRGPVAEPTCAMCQACARG